MSKLRFVEIYRGKDEQWKGYHNVMLDSGEDKVDQPCIGMFDPELSLGLMAMAEEKENNSKDMKVLESIILDLCGGIEEDKEKYIDEWMKNNEL